MKKTITHKEWLDGMDKEEAVFRLFGKFFSGRSCYQCVHYRRSANGKYACFSTDHEADCRDEFNRWLSEDMED